MGSCSEVLLDLLPGHLLRLFERDSGARRLKLRLLLDQFLLRLVCFPLPVQLDRLAAELLRVSILLEGSPLGERRFLPAGPLVVV